MVAKRRYLLKDRLQLVMRETGTVRRVFEIAGLSKKADIHLTVDSARSRFAARVRIGPKSADQREFSGGDRAIV